MSMKKQRGSASNMMLGLVAATTITGGMVVQQNTWQTKDPAKRAESAEIDVKQLTSAANRFFLENRTFPTTVNQLVAAGFYTGSVQSPYGTPYVITTLPSGNITVTFDAQSNRDRSFVLSKIRGTQELANGIRLEVAKPAREAVQSNLLHRVAIAGRPELNRMETDINMDNNSINNVNAITAQTATVTNLTATNTNATTLTVTDYMDFGTGGRIQSSGSNLLFNSSNVSFSNDFTVGNNLTVANNLNVTGNSTFTGNLSVNGNIALSGGSLTGFNNIQGNTMTLSGALVSNSLSTSVLNANSVTANSFNVTNTLNATNGVFGDFNTNNLTANNFVVNGTMTYGGLTVTNTLNSSGTSSFGSATINTLNSTNSNLGAATASTLGVSGNLTTDRLTTNTWTTGTHTSTTMNATTGNFDTANIVNLNGTNAVFNTATANRIESSFLVSNSAELNNLVVTGNMTVQGTLGANAVNVTGNTTTNGLNASTGNINTLTAGTGTFTTLNATNVNGQRFNGTDFVTANASVNSNYALIQNYINQWNSCVLADGCQ